MAILLLVKHETYATTDLSQGEHTRPPRPAIESHRETRQHHRTMLDCVHLYPVHDPAVVDLAVAHLIRVVIPNQRHGIAKVAWLPSFFAATWQTRLTYEDAITVPAGVTNPDCLPGSLLSS